VNNAPGRVPARAGSRYWIVKDVYTFRVTGAESGGAFALVDAAIEPGHGPPLHSHSSEEECFYIIDGEMWFEIDGRVVTAGPGAVVHAPRHSVHRFENKTDRPVHMLIWVAPSGLENYFAEIGDPAADPPGPPPEPDIARMLARAADYGLTFYLPETP